MRSSLQLLLLFATLVVVAALVGSFFAGLGGGAPGAAMDPAAELVRTRVEVLNGTTRPGLARSVTQRLRDAGFDVVYFGNGPRTDSTVVLDRAGRPEVARAVAEALGVRQVRSRPDPGLYLDATVILGADWPPRPDSARAGQGWWARLRRWWRGERPRGPKGCCPIPGTVPRGDLRASAPSRSSPRDLPQNCWGR